MCHVAWLYYTTPGRTTIPKRFRRFDRLCISAPAKHSRQHKNNRTQSEVVLGHFLLPYDDA
jgi:hypothetical protein